MSTDPHTSAGSWFVLAGSSTGRSHLAAGTGCEDAWYHEQFSPGIGLAIVCDGAGSAANSRTGADHVARICAPAIFRNFLNANSASGALTLPEEDVWAAFCLDAFEAITTSLRTLAVDQQLPYASLACTAIVVIYSPKGILVTHVGDGRAGYRDSTQQWLPLMTPHKGEEANQTIFLTSVDWKQNPALLMSGLPVPESRVIAAPVTGFTLMTDGCEQHAWVCSVMEDSEKRWHDPNLPYSPFFEPLISGLAGMAAEQLSTEKAEAEWTSFLAAGTPGLAGEPDDKTMILGTLI